MTCNKHNQPPRNIKYYSGEWVAVTFACGCNSIDATVQAVDEYFELFLSGRIERNGDVVNTPCKAVEL